ncbi:MAG: hypothetical protein K8H88_01190, partial [Sandaracinaceae bacterium]|nr:hypothetical protein [Sandaracinaceae bacterium]
LHLISGPLGTMVGLYETAIEHLATWRAPDGTAVRPRVIASTATVRRAREQVAALFGRDRMALFPPPGVDDSDTFFAQIDRESPGRLYVGVAAPGRSMKAILRRSYIDLLCAAQKVFSSPAGRIPASPAGRIPEISPQRTQSAQSTELSSLEAPSSSAPSVSSVVNSSSAAHRDSPEAAGRLPEFSPQRTQSTQSTEQSSLKPPSSSAPSVSSVVNSSSDDSFLADSSSDSPFKPATAQQRADPYMTLVGYFNSLRELGGMRRLVEDEVHTHSRDIDKRVPEDRVTPNPWFAVRDVKGEPAELTSREGTFKIAAYKARLALPHVDPDRVDVLLASNMISVGVDIDRLGLMVVAGQPKTTSEYIQASSRVGRQHPGLVVTCFNTRKPRDRSHYERFAAYHASFYRFVEAQSLTPFSGPALERGLAGTLVAMTRLTEGKATPPAAAMQIAALRGIGDHAVHALGERAARMAGSKTKREEAAKNVERRGKNLLDAWDRLVTSLASGKDGAAAGKLYYSPYDRDKASVHMLHTTLDDPRPDLGTDYPKFRAPTSMRDVEPSVHLWIERGTALGGKT